MPEMVACPVCDCRILVNEMQLGLRIRCINCEHSFVAGEACPVPEPTVYSLHPKEVADEEAAVVGRRVEPTRHRLPLCPKCHRPVGWEDVCCAHCGRLFDPEDGGDRASWQARRDALAHRGDLIMRLGSYAQIGGCIAVCTGPLGALFAVGCGVPAWWMAHIDLAGMDAGRVDPAGRDATEAGKGIAIGGLFLALVFSIFWTLVIIKP